MKEAAELLKSSQQQVGQFCNQLTGVMMENYWLNKWPAGQQAVNKAAECFMLVAVNVSTFSALRCQC